MVQKTWAILYVALLFISKLNFIGVFLILKDPYLQNILCLHLTAEMWLDEIGHDRAIVVYY